MEEKGQSLSARGDTIYSCSAKHEMNDGRAAEGKGNRGEEACGDANRASVLAGPYLHMPVSQPSTSCVVKGEMTLAAVEALTGEEGIGRIFDRWPLGLGDRNPSGPGVVARDVCLAVRQPGRQGGKTDKGRMKDG